MPTNHLLSSVEMWVLGRIHDATGRAPIGLILNDGVQLLSPASVADVVIRDRRTLGKLILDPEVAFGEAYADGRIEVEGDLVALLGAVYMSMPNARPASWYARLASHWLKRTQANTLTGSRKNIHQHYDLGTDFYKLWLDPELVYTCAYFPSPSATLEEAQTAKMEHVCRKLQLQPGEKVVEAGCGWGALALYMARNYGVSVKAFNISREQILFARQRAREEGLSNQVEFIEDDYRNVSGGFEAFVSVGMLEHVGQEHYAELGAVIHRSLGNSGRGLLHFIGRNHPRPFSAWTRKRIFPGAYAPTLGQALEMLEPLNFSVLDVENLRLHYAKTLEHWLENFEISAQRISEMFDPSFVRTWRLYLSGALAGFRVGTLQLFQIVFAGPACRRISWTRAHLYGNETPAEQEPKWIHAMS
jgi:cyclopropane-fatty-acyl-phospholipid synthase